MAKRKNGRVDTKMALVIIAAALVLAVGVVLLFVGGGREQTGNKSPSQTDPRETTPPSVTIPIVIEEQAPYEYWLLANMVSVLTIEYPDFQNLELFISGETVLADRMESRGAWIRFVSGGQSIVIQSLPLEAERTEKGTQDIHSSQTQFATYDVVEEADLSGMTQLTLEDITNELIQISLSSVYPH